MFEHRHQSIATLPVFLGRLLKALVLGGVIVGMSLFLGVLGYRNLEAMSWLGAAVMASVVFTLTPVKGLLVR